MEKMWKKKKLSWFHLRENWGMGRLSNMPKFTPGWVLFLAIWLQNQYFQWLYHTLHCVFQKTLYFQIFCNSLFRVIDMIFQFPYYFSYTLDSSVSLLDHIQHHIYFRESLGVIRFLNCCISELIYFFIFTFE